MFQKVFLRSTEARRFRSGMIVLCAIGVTVLVAVGASPLLALGTVTVRVNPATRAVPGNGTFTVDIVADVGAEMAPNGLGAYEFDLVYDPSYLEANSVSDTGELSSTNRTVSALGPNIDNPGGRTTFAAYSYPPQDVAGPNSTVALAEVTLQAKRAGVTTLNLENALLTDTHANAWPDGGERVLNVGSGMVWNIIDAFSHFTDFDGDGKSDPALWDPAEKRYKWKQSGNNYTLVSTIMIPSNAIPLAGDFDGDGKADPALWLPTNLIYKWKKSGSGYALELRAIGPANAVPLVGDFDGDGKADPATYNPDNAVFRWQKSGDSYNTKVVGIQNQGADAIPLVGDFDGDGKDDPASWDPATEQLRWKNSESGYSPSMKVISPSTGMPFAADFDGDGKADPATWDSATQIFRWKSSGSGYSPAMKVIGPSTGIPLVGFFDGDNKADPATWDPDTMVLRWKESGNSYAPESKVIGPSTGVPTN